MTKSLTTQKKLSLVPFTLDGVSTETKKTYSYALRAYEGYLKKTKQSPGIDSMLEWIEKVQEPRTQHVYISAIKRVLTEVYGNDPRFPELDARIAKIKPVRIDRTIKEADFLRQVEVNALIRGTTEKIGLIIETLFWTGCRISELLNIKIDKCYIGEKNVSVEIIGKGRKQRTVYMKKRLFNKILTRFRGQIFLFEHHGKKYNRNYVSFEIRKAGEKILGKKISAHTMRHSKAMYLKDVKKLTPDMIQKALGHESVQTTLEHYFHGVPTAKDQGI